MMTTQGTSQSQAESNLSSNAPMPTIIKAFDKKNGETRGLLSRLCLRFYSASCWEIAVQNIGQNIGLAVACRCHPRNPGHNQAWNCIWLS